LDCFGISLQPAYDTSVNFLSKVAIHFRKKTCCYVNIHSSAHETTPLLSFNFCVSNFKCVMSHYLRKLLAQVTFLRNVQMC